MSERPDLPSRTPQAGFWSSAWLVFKTLQARLRFVAVLAAVGLVIGNWETLHSWYEKLTRPPAARQTAEADTEYFCPMHPAIVRDNPKEKCPICFMPLSKRKKGDEEPLPPGIVSRVQLSPYRIVLAGVQTSPVEYRRPAQEITTVGFVEFDERRLAHIAARVKGRIDRLFVNVTGQMVKAGDELASIYSPDLVDTVQTLLNAQRAGNKELLQVARDRLRLWDISDNQIDEILKTGKANTHLKIRSPIGGHVIRKYQVEGKYVEEGTSLYDVADLGTVWIQAQVYEDELAFLQEGLPVRATTPAFPGRAFLGRLSFVFPHLDRSSRTLTVRFDIDNADHALRPGMYATVTIQIPEARLDLFAQARAEDWRNETAVDLAARAPLAAWGRGGVPGVQPLLRAAVQQAALRAELLPVVPESAVIDTGSRKIVYREVTTGVYEGVEVELGPRSKEFYPVVRGLEPGERVVTTGSFLIDAETRLNPAAGSIYFGGSGGRGAAASSVRPSTVEELTAEDRRLIEAQQFCPVRANSKLGSMGTPVRLVLHNQPVYLCCSGCLDKARANPERTLTRVAEFKSQGKSAAAAPEVAEFEAKVRANLDQLGADRAAAAAQRFCPVSESRLGDPGMGVPVKVAVKGRVVFVCCGSCRGPVLADPDQMLAKIERLKAREKAAAPQRSPAAPRETRRTAP
jgi:Cu(I)/Ag(I) efflux system membrane fusion protein